MKHAVHNVSIGHSACSLRAERIRGGRTRSSAPTCLLLAVALLLPACFGGNTTERTYFAIDYPVEQTWSYATARFPYQVRVQRFDSALAYDRQELVYRASPHQFQYYWYKLWASKPSKMLREVLVRHLRHAAIFSDVTLDLGDRMPDYDLACEILAIEELNAASDQWFARLAMRLILTDFEDGSVVWEYEFDERRPVYNRAPVYVVQTLSEIARVELSRAFAQLDELLGESGEHPAPEGGPTQMSEMVSTPDEASTENQGPQPSAKLKRRKK
ncbi:MAG: ABC-type transport auxiliary lipoprotein family protein [Myxococcota bacterium]|jgi:ABC-type uncharacterized transport system auxiliary subunit|nr:ABC-type transport auxiliary lipoprotein family protein [Myxococcota bacterium]